MSGVDFVAGSVLQTLHPAWYPPARIDQLSIASSGRLSTHIAGAGLAKLVLHNILDIRVHLLDQIQEGLHMLLSLLL